MKKVFYLYVLVASLSTNATPTPHGYPDDATFIPPQQSEKYFYTCRDNYPGIGFGFDDKVPAEICWRAMDEAISAFNTDTK
ncbi:hypothetical protein K0I73_14520 [Shewanella mesophila]|uniref:hypothetical protein n=1 Tax=Shewanella mesophila TaxID=2864208 RepID=UPI001C658A70|nr:hypothetical protein [Shewanella mesophila]QYJ85405.1 hypothetical protein K0I73_14520 [Shewanella mesophila]